MKDFHRRLHDLRREKELSQRALGELSCINYITIGRYERQQSLPSINSLIQLANALETTIDYLVEGKIDESVVDDCLKPELFDEVEIFVNKVNVLSIKLNRKSYAALLGKIKRIIDG